jgi:hypothetical protein
VHLVELLVTTTPRQTGSRAHPHSLPRLAVRVASGYSACSRLFKGRFARSSSCRSRILYHRLQSLALPFFISFSFSILYGISNSADSTPTRPSSCKPRGRSQPFVGAVQGDEKVALGEGSSLRSQPAAENADSGAKR